MNTADQSDYQFLNLSSILPATTPDIRQSHFNLSLSYRFPIAIAASEYQTPDPWEAAIAIADAIVIGIRFRLFAITFLSLSYRKV